MPEQEPSSNYYKRLGVSPTASPQQIRRAYREMSKLYHPDTTELAAAIATTKFHALNEAYATLSSPEKRFSYDLKMGFSRVSVIRTPNDLNRSTAESRQYRSSAYLDPTDRPLSGGEIFALFILGLTFAACLILVVTIGLTRGEVAFGKPNPVSENEPVIEQPLAAPELNNESNPSDSLFQPQPLTPVLAIPPFASQPSSVIPDTSAIERSPEVLETVPSVQTLVAPSQLEPEAPHHRNHPLQSSINAASETSDPLEMTHSSEEIPSSAAIIHPVQPST